ncbi:MAG: colanic acid biosynthesis protein [archaeon ADurb.Bin336]|nr:MAG: colanic acid biosynthesis protein [archaeon ADurb.Bin336]
MKKILILHAYNTYNYGSFMMLINFIEYNYKENKNLKFCVELDSKEDFERLKKEISKEIKIYFIKKKKFNYKKIKGKINGFLYKQLFSQIEIIKQKYSAVVILGGDDLSEYYAGWQVSFELLKIFFLSKKVPVFLIGQTIGPFNYWRKKIAKLTLSKSHIYLRDSLCKEYLEKEIGLNNLVLSSDLAFLDLPNQKKYLNFYKNFKIKKENYITLVPSGLVKQYTSNENDYINNWIILIKNLIKNPKFKNKKVVLLAHVLKPSSTDDRIIIDKIYSKLENNFKKNIVLVKEELLPSQARSILGNGLFTITGRMHAAISTLQMKKPAISLAYSVKYAGIIGKDLELDLVIEAKGNTIWKNKKIVFDIERKVKDLISSKIKLNSKTQSKIKMLKKFIKQNKELVLQLNNCI